MFPVTHDGPGHTGNAREILGAYPTGKRLIFQTFQEVNSEFPCATPNPPQDASIWGTLGTISKLSVNAM